MILAQIGDMAQVGGKVIEGTAGRSDTTFLATIITGGAVIAMVICIRAFVNWLPKHTDSLTKSFAAEMAREREFHKERTDHLAETQRKSSEEVSGAIRYLADSINSKQQQRRRKPPGNSTTFGGLAEPG